jgi:hypothetical protein
MARFTRRYFFYGSLLAGAIPKGGFGSTTSLKAAGYKSPNEKLNIASIGAGGKAYTDIHGCAPTENIVALCDVDDKQSARSFGEFPKAPKYKDFRKMLDKVRASTPSLSPFPISCIPPLHCGAWSAASTSMCRSR